MNAGAMGVAPAFFCLSSTFLARFVSQIRFSLWKPNMSFANVHFRRENDGLAGFLLCARQFQNHCRKTSSAF
jgi:hypothetical protein